MDDDPLSFAATEPYADALPRLQPAALAGLPDAVARPLYNRTELRAGIVHLGLGSFARAFLGVVNETAIHAGGEPHFGIVGVSLRSPAVRDALAPQQGLYTVARRDADATGTPRSRLQVIGNLIGQLVAPEDPKAVLEAIAARATRIVSLTVTEKGYAHDPASGRLREDHPDIAHDLQTGGQASDAPRSVIGFIVHGLALRRARRLPPVTLLSLDNLPHNGRTLQSLVIAFARRVDPALAEWIERQCTFPSSMVDRIVPATTEADRAQVAAALGYRDAWPVIAEPYLDWVVEDRFAAGRPDWHLAGARCVSDASAWEQLKLRAVNGSHSALAYLGAMAGWRTVDEAVAQPEMRAFVHAMLTAEVRSTLPPLPSLDFERYVRGLLERFANPALAHRLQQIAMDGSQKLPQRLLATIEQRLAGGESIARLALAVAAWMHYLRGIDEWGRPYPIDDPLAEALAAARSAAEGEATLRERVGAFTHFAPVFGDLAGHATLVDALTKALASLQGVGVRTTLAHWARSD
ncbi:MAG: mannitol dehydrogenase family protein [Burkholderiales bacterium]|nr:mannitol dehydrogenase family protein [Burkholderiales bacterium]